MTALTRLECAGDNLSARAILASGPVAARSDEALEVVAAARAGSYPDACIASGEFAYRERLVDQCSEVGLDGGTCRATRVRRQADHLDGMDIAGYVVNDQATLGQLIGSIASHVAKVVAAGVVAAAVGVGAPTVGTRIGTFALGPLIVAIAVGIGSPSMPSTINFGLTAKLHRSRGNRAEQAQQRFPPAAPALTPGGSYMAKNDRIRLHSAWLAILMATLGSWLVVWSGRALWLELSAISHSAPLVELRADAASGLPAGLSLLALLATMTVGSRSARWGRSALIVAICALPLVVILPAVLLFGAGGYLSSKGYVECPDQLGGQRFPVIRKVLPEARALCADDVHSE